MEAAGGFEPPNKGFAVQGQRVTNSYQVLTTSINEPRFRPVGPYQVLPTQNGEKVEDKFWRPHKMQNPVMQIDCLGECGTR